MLDLGQIKSIFKLAPAAHIILGSDLAYFTIIWVNPAFLSSAGVQLEDLAGKSIFQLFNNSSQADTQNENNLLNKALNDCIASKNVMKAGVQRFTKQIDEGSANELQLWNCSAYPLLDEQDEISYLVLTLDDVTKKFNQLSPVSGLIPDTDAQHPLLKDYPDAIFTLNVDGMFLSANRTLLEIAECSMEELLKLSFVPFLPPEDLEGTVNNFKRSISGEILNFDIQIISFRGRRTSLNITPIPIRSNHDVIGLYIVAKDITAVIRAQQELNEQRKQIEVYNQKMYNILESITDGFYAVDRYWRVTYWNKEAERILQRPREDIIGKGLWDVYSPELVPELYEAYHQAIEKNISVQRRIYFDPRKAWIEATAFPSEDGLSIYFKDITARKKIEDKLNEAKIQYQNLFDLSPLPQWVYGLEDFHFKDVNQAAIALYGYSKEEFLSMSIKDLKLSHEVKILEAVLMEQANNNKFHRTIGRHVKKSGEVIDVQVDANSIIYEGKAARLVLSVDITEKLKAEDAIIASEQKFKALVQDGSDLLAILDSLGNFIYVNQTTARILNIPEEKFLGNYAVDFVLEEDKERVIREFNALAHKQTHKISPFRFRNGQGAYIWLETIITNMTDDPAVGGVVCNSRDVTNWIETELKIQQSIDRYNIVSKATSDCIWDYDVTTGVVVWNDALTKLFGYKSGNHPVNWWDEHLHPDDSGRVKSQIEFLIHNKQNHLNTEYRFRCADGSYKNILDRSFLMFNEQGALVRMIGSMQDITEREMYVQTVEQQNQRLKEIAWTQSHVVRAPLARIMGIADLLSDGGMDEATNEELRSHLAVSAEELDNIIRDIILKTETLYKGAD